MYKRLTLVLAMTIAAMQFALPTTAQQHARKQLAVPQFKVMKSARSVARAADTSDDHGIITTPPEGVRKVYSRSGMSYINDRNYGMQTASQQGTVHIVECEDGTVYIRNILAAYPTGTWVKGVREGNTITVKARQPIYWNAMAETSYSIGWGYCEDNWGSLSFSYYGSEDITFTIDPETSVITLDGSSENLFIGLFWDDDDAFANYGDWASEWTYTGDFEPMSTTEVSAPATEVESWYMRAHRQLSEEQQLEGLPLVKGTVDVAVSNGEIWLKGLFADYPDGWMKGTLSDDGTATFYGLQLQGQADGQPVYAVGTAGGDLVPFVMTYDADSQQLTSQCGLLANTSTTDIAAVDAYADITITLADPYAPIETLPYINTIDSKEDFEWFTIIDANSDGSTWHHFVDDRGYASYQYNSDNAADDWLISPAFHLEAGKTYAMAVDMNCSSAAFNERFEVMMGGEATAEAMTTTVIEPTEIVNDQPVTFQNKLITVSQTGTYYFGIHAISDADLASLRASNFVVDETIIEAPTAVSELTAVVNSVEKTIELSFTAPSHNIGGDPLTDNIAISISRDGETITTLNDVAPGTTLSYTDQEPPTGKHTYIVTTANAFGKGESVSTTATLTPIFDIPYFADFSADDTYDLFTTINANDDGGYWENNISYAGYSYSSDNAADDYLVSPGLIMEAGKHYAISIDVEAAGSYPERFEVLVGTQPSAEGLTTVVIEPTEINGDQGRMTFEGSFNCEQSGIYYACVHAISDADMYILQVYALNIEVGPEPTAPAAPELTVTPGAEGSLSATLTIQVPATAIDGTALSTNLTKMEVVRDGETVNVMEDIKPGTTITYQDEADDLTSGAHTYQVIPYNADGIGNKSSKVTVYIGLDTPIKVDNVKVKDLLTSVQFSWDKVGNVGTNGGYVNPDEVDYNIWACEPNSTYMFASEPVATVRASNSFELPFDTNEGEQGYQAWLVTAANESGESYIYDADLITLTVGKPYDLPFMEGFTDGNFHYYCDYVGVPLLYSLSSDGDDNALALTSQQENSLVALTTGKLNIKDAAKPTLLIDAAAFGADNFSVIASKNGDTDNAVVLAENIEIDNTGYKTITVDLSSLKDADYIMLAFMARIPTASVFDDWTGEMTEEGDALIIDNIRIIDSFEHNLAIEAMGPESLQAGNNSGIIATVTNWGEQSAKDFTVTIMAGNEVLKQQTVSDELAPFESTTVVADLKTTIFTEADDIEVKATVEYASDQNEADNENSIVITITEPIAPAPENLLADSKGEAGTDLSWSAPTTTAVFTESFENGMGGWTSIDADDDSFGWKLSKYGESDYTMDTNSGLGCVYSESYDNSSYTALTPDNWLVSPQVVLDGTFSFYAKGQDPDWCDENFAIYVATGDPTDPQNFTQVSEELTATGNMTMYEADLSNYGGQTGYVAIRHYDVTDKYILVVDDITYTMGGQPAAYNIYYEGTLMATVEGSKTTFTAEAAQIEAGQRSFAVSAVYGNGQESRPVNVVIDVTTAIATLTIDGTPVDIYSLDGKLLRRQVTTTEGLKGVYVVNGKTVIVR